MKQSQCNVMWIILWCIYLSQSLQSGQKYYYIVGDNCSWSEEYSFTAPPPANQTFVIVAYGGIFIYDISHEHNIVAIMSNRVWVCSSGWLPPDP